MQDDRGDLRRKAFRGLAILIGALAVCLFLPALTLAWWQAWLYLLIFAGATFATTAYLLEHDPELVAHRLRAGPTAEREPRQKLIQGVLSVVFVLLLIVPGLDHLFRWSHVPNAVVFAADAAVAVGFWIVFRTFRENSFASSIIEVRDGQRVVTSGTLCGREASHVCRCASPPFGNTSRARIVVGADPFCSRCRRNRVAPP